MKSGIIIKNRQCALRSKNNPKSIPLQDPNKQMLAETYQFLSLWVGPQAFWAQYLERVGKNKKENVWDNLLVFQIILNIL